MADMYKEALLAILNSQGNPYTYQSYGPVSQDTGASSPIAQLSQSASAGLSPELTSWLNSYGSNIAYSPNPDGSYNLQVKEPGGKTGTIIKVGADGSKSIVQTGAPMNTNQDNSWAPTMLAMYGGSQLAQGLLGGAGTGVNTPLTGAEIGATGDQIMPSIYGAGSGWGGDTLSALDSLSGAAPGTAAAANGMTGLTGATTALGNVIPSNPTSAGTFASGASGAGGVAGAGGAGSGLLSGLSSLTGLDPNVLKLLAAGAGGLLSYFDAKNTLNQANNSPMQGVLSNIAQRPGRTFDWSSPYKRI
jgi:hypothetical protein